MNSEDRSIKTANFTIQRTNGTILALRILKLVYEKHRNFINFVVNPLTTMSSAKATRQGAYYIDGKDIFKSQKVKAEIRELSQSQLIRDIEAQPKNGKRQTK